VSELKFYEPDLFDPRTLEPGDQVSLTDNATRLRIMVGRPLDGYEDEIWLTLVNTPGETTHVPEYGWMRPLPHGNVALDFVDHGWVWGVYPTVWARREIR
jgi:hypothetical protein